MRLVFACTFLAVIFSGYFLGFSQEIPAIDPNFVLGTNDFGLRLLRTVWQQERGNAFVSPVSLATCLAMVAHGAKGATQEEIYRTLGVLALRERVDEESRKLIASLDFLSSGITLKMANSLWVEKNAPFFETYLTAIEDFYQAEGYTVDLTDPATLPRINDWVRTKTQGTIERILDSLPENAVLVLLNATYFKGQWAKAFDPEHTENLPFTTLQGSKDVPTMWQRGEFAYLETDTFQAVRLPYTQEALSMYIFLPKERDGLSALLEALDAQGLASFIDAMQEERGEVFLPRLQVSFEKTMNDVLRELGMVRVFDPYGADLSGMLPVSPAYNAYLSEVRHKTFLEVNEEGTEAAGVTSGIIAITAMYPDRFIMRIDHPFFLCIRDERTGVLLFVGAIENPI
ncbi:MAG: serpin family protein [Candidatus Caldatribacterium sp.]|uniref:serpin family protein n=1 Tax=Candidatus Caldatribacterium sp. TaxID=2282143 RepID=UPI002997CEE4|nr:serpin family protein [Candidatus Caldatribacterium sp.]MCX7730587.1 serpin family protein [Candidatus Caldatribacterium sp.]MDW8081073.1 serpin family protein [Candidatus Calescibacterium sp.]